LSIESCHHLIHKIGHEVLFSAALHMEWLSRLVCRSCWYWWAHISNKAEASFFSKQAGHHQPLATLDCVARKQGTPSPGQGVFHQLLLACGFDCLRGLPCGEPPLEIIIPKSHQKMPSYPHKVSYP
jgi:hypothetical protein